jgi:lactaldehyde dehydrogenase / glycolaldehyde dehydrogenase
VTGAHREPAMYIDGTWVAAEETRAVINQTAQSEVFGPMLPIQAFDDLEEAIDLPNDPRYGLTSYVFTSNLHGARRATDDIDFGEIYVNKIGPEQLQGFHTGYRRSGMGGDDGPYGYERYLRRKTVYLHYDGFGTPAELYP